MNTRLPALSLALWAAASNGSAQEHVPPPHPVPPAASAVRLERIRLSTGVELEVAQAGPPDGTPVLFLHGSSDSWFSWTRVLERLPAGVRAIVPSQRGHGDSESPDCCYRMRDYAADAVALLGALGIERVALVGHSMGSIIAQNVAVQYPERVERLMLIGSSNTTQLPVLAEFNAFVQTLTDPVDREFIREFQESTMTVPVPAEFLRRVIEESGKLPAHVWHGMIEGLYRGSVEDELHKVLAPTTLVWGEKDGFFDRAAQDALLRAVAGARLIAYENTGHAPHWERPERFVEDLKTFLETAPRPPAP